MLLWFILILLAIWLIGAILTTREEGKAYRFGWNWPKRAAASLVDRFYNNHRRGSD